MIGYEGLKNVMISKVTVTAKTVCPMPLTNQFLSATWLDTFIAPLYSQFEQRTSSVFFISTIHQIYVVKHIFVTKCFTFVLTDRAKKQDFE